MRRSSGFALLLLAAACLAACQDEASERAALIQASADRCSEGLAASTAQRLGMVPKGMDPDRICTCAAEQAAEGKTLAELREMSEARIPAFAQLKAIGACVVADARRGGILRKERDPPTANPAEKGGAK